MIFSACIEYTPKTQSVIFPRTKVKKWVAARYRGGTGTYFNIEAFSSKTSVTVVTHENQAENFDQTKVEKNNCGNKYHTKCPEGKSQYAYGRLEGAGCACWRDGNQKGLRFWI